MATLAARFLLSPPCQDRPELPRGLELLWREQEEKEIKYAPRPRGPVEEALGELMSLVMKDLVWASLPSLPHHKEGLEMLAQR